MTTIKELYDLGQRQFPMRGGGISPVLELYAVNNKYKGRLFCYAGTNDGYWDLEGNYDYCGTSPDPHPLDLLPIPLPDYQARLKAAENYIAEIAKCDEINREQFAMDYFRFGERLEVLQAKYEALVKACEPFLDKLSLRDKRDAETGSYLWNDSHIEMHQVHFRNLAAAIRGE